MDVIRIQVIKTYLSDVYLNGSMILSVKDSVGGRALSWDVEINELTLVVLEDWIAMIFAKSYVLA